MTSKLNVAVAALLALLATSALAQDPIGIVKRIKGDVVIDRAGVQVAPVAGTEVFRGDRLITGAAGYASISMHRAASLAVGPDTAIALQRFAPADKVVEKPAPRILQSLASFLAVNRQR